MTITYYGHSCFRVKGKNGTVIFDPYSSAVGWPLPTLSADVVVSSHDHFDHNAIDAIKPTTRREKVFSITKAGEYEIGGISVFSVKTFHDDQEGVQRGENLVSTILMDHLRITHLGDLGHLLDASQQEQIGTTDILLIPIGGVFTLNPDQAVKVIHLLEPSVVIPMHYKTEKHDPKLFVELATVQDFLKAYSVEAAPQPMLDISLERLPEETSVVILTEQV